jgi:uncharacterized membrane protein
MTIDLSSTIDVDASPDAVWAILADYRRDPGWRTGVVSMTASTPGTAVDGTRTEEVLRFGGRTLRNDGVVTAVEPGRRLEWRTTAGADAAGSRLVEDLGGGRSRVTLELWVTPHGWERLAAPVLGRLLAANLRRDLARLRGLLNDRAESLELTTRQRWPG